MNLSVKLQQNTPIISSFSEQEIKSVQDEIICGKNIKFNYINIDKLIDLLKSKNISTIDLYHIDILKYNYNNIILQLADYFPDVKISKFENSPCVSECENFNIDSTYKYDIYLVLSKEDKLYEYGFDFFESIEDNPENKFSHSKILLDNYEYFYSMDISSNADIVNYLNDTIFGLLIAICSMKNDEYKLAEILYTKLNKDKMTPKQLEKELEYFIKIINWKKLDTIDLNDLYFNLMLINNETEEEISFKGFKKIIKNICDKFEIKFNIKQTNIDFDIFEKIILYMNTNYASEILDFYKDTYQKSMSMLMESLKLIIKLTSEMNIRKKFFARYITFLIEYKLSDYKNQYILNKIYLEKINDKKKLFEKLLEQINTYYEKNKHNEDELDKINFNFSSLYDNLFNI